MIYFSSKILYGENFSKENMTKMNVITTVKSPQLVEYENRGRIEMLKNKQVLLFHEATNKNQITYWQEQHLLHIDINNAYTILQPKIWKVLEKYI